MKSKSKRKSPEIVLRGGKPAAVIIDIDEYRSMLAARGCRGFKDAQRNEKQATEVP
jgi:hypothetical protein